MADDTEAEGRAEWERRARAMEEAQARVGAFPVPGLLRRARRLADLSQHQLAAKAQVPQSTVARVESGALAPSLKLFQRLLNATGLSLVVVDHEGRVVQPMRESDDTRDGGGRRYPSHLDTILDPRPGEWWADQFGLVRPPETFYRDRRRRDAQRIRSQWEVRVKQLRNAPEPPHPDRVSKAEAARRWLAELRQAGQLPPEIVDYRDLDWDE